MSQQLTQEEIEEAAIKSALNHGAFERGWIPDPDTGEYVYVDLKNPSAEAIEVMGKIVEGMKK